MLEELEVEGVEFWKEMLNVDTGRREKSGARKKKRRRRGKGGSCLLRVT
jgi:hypothetical protein